MMLDDAIFRRRSVRHFTDEQVFPEDIEKLISVAYKIPSAGAIRPLKIHLVADKNVKEKLCAAALNQGSIKEAPVVFVVAANFTEMIKRYHRRGYRYTFMEAGHMGQNIALEAVSLNLGTVMIGAFRDEEVKKVLGIVDDPLYIIPIGRPKEAVDG